VQADQKGGESCAEAPDISMPSSVILEDAPGLLPERSWKVLRYWMNTAVRLRVAIIAKKKNKEKKERKRRRRRIGRRSEDDHNHNHNHNEIMLR